MAENTPSQDYVDRKNLTQKELLILLADRVEQTNKAISETNQSLTKLSEDYVNLLVRVNRIETRSKTWSSMWGAAAILFSAIMAILTYIK